MKIFLALFAFCLLVNGQIITTLIPNNFGLFGPIGMNEDGGFLYICDAFNNRVVKLDPANLAGAVNAFSSGGTITNPSGITFDGAGNFVFTQETSNTGNKIVFINITDTASTNRICSTSPTNCGAASTILNPDDIKNFNNEVLYFSELSNNKVKRLNLTDFSIVDFAGTGAPGFSGDGGLATAAQLDFPVGLALDKAGNLYISDANNQRVRKVDVKTNIITTFAGNGTKATTGNGGAAINAAIDAPFNLAFDAFGNLFVAQQFGIRKINPNGIITMLNSGNVNLTTGFAGDGEDVSKALFSGVRYLYMTKLGNLLVSDTDALSNNRIRQIQFANRTCTTNRECEFSCFRTDCDKTAGVCNFGTLILLNADGNACREGDFIGTCLAGECLDKVPFTGAASVVTISMMFIVVLASILMF